MDTIEVAADGTVKTPPRPVIPFIEGDGTGRDIWRASVRVFDAAVADAIWTPLRLVHSGHVGDQIAFLTVGATALAAALLLLYR